MGNHQLLASLSQGIDTTSKLFEPVGTTLGTSDLIFLMGNSIVLGFVLMLLTLAVSLPTMNSHVMGGVTAEKLAKKKFESVISAMNILFLCVGLSAIMILVSNNLARALAVGATLGLIRFRINLNSKMVGSNMLFGIIAGISCGLQEVTVGWLVTSVYVVLQGGLYLVLRTVNKSLLEEVLISGANSEEQAVASTQVANTSENIPGTSTLPKPQSQLETPPQTVQ